MKRLNLLVSAEPFGFGPIGKLMSIVEQLKELKYNITFLGCGTAKTVVSMNQGLFDNVVELDVNHMEKHAELFEQCDAILSVMESSLVITGFAYGKKTYYVDSLSFLWRSNLEQSDLEKMKSELESNINKAFDTTRTIEMHNSQALAHYIADTSFVQQYGSRVKHSIHITNHQEIEAIVPYFESKVEMEPTDLLVTLSGQLSAFATEKSSIDYVRMVCNIIDNIETLYPGDLKIDIAINPKVLAFVDEETKANYNFCSFSHQEMNEKIKQSKLLLAPPGLTTALESIFLGTPYLLLPDQHYAHHFNRAILAPNSDFSPMNFELDKMPTDPKAATIHLQQQASALLPSADLVSVVDSFSQKVVNFLAAPALLDVLIQEQKSNFNDCFGGFNGALQIKKHINQQVD